ncbi:hypothetical protein ALC53_03870 [Atta colombica]|uniref:Uncharacterized protein n=1 Tax=Atta colombica TaxID=520822 RepID=A0A195BN17_9HYME|nr:hypothetical protein ALC53_03870 [Atta colombica]
MYLLLFEFNVFRGSRMLMICTLEEITVRQQPLLYNLTFFVCSIMFNKSCRRIDNALYPAWHPESNDEKVCLLKRYFYFITCSKATPSLKASLCLQSILLGSKPVPSNADLNKCFSIPPAHKYQIILLFTNIIFKSNPLNLLPCGCLLLGSNDK